MATSRRRGDPILLQSAVTGASPGRTLEVGEVESCTIEISGTYTGLEAAFEVSIDGGTRFWPVDLQPLTGGTGGPKMTAPGLYLSGDGLRAATHIRVPVTTPGSPTGTMSVKLVFIRW